MTKARDIASAAPAPSTVSATELGYLDGVSSAIQTQLDAKTAKSTLSTTGDIYYASSANTPARLGIGSTGNVLTVASGIPSWAAPAASGGMTLIQETVASTSSGIDFNTISGSYKQLMLVWSGVEHSGSGSAFPIRFNSNSNSVYANISLAATATTFTNSIELNSSLYAGNNLAWSPFGNNANTTSIQDSVNGFLLIDNYASTSKTKFYEGEWAFWDGASIRQVAAFHGVFNDTTAITSVNIFRSGGSATLTNRANTSIRLYGIS